MDVVSAATCQSNRHTNSYRYSYGLHLHGQASGHGLGKEARACGMGSPSSGDDGQNAQKPSRYFPEDDFYIYGFLRYL